MTAGDGLPAAPERGLDSDGRDERQLPCASCDGTGVREVLAYCTCPTGTGKRARDHSSDTAEHAVLLNNFLDHTTTSTGATE